MPPKKGTGAAVGGAAAAKKQKTGPAAKRARTEDGDGPPLPPAAVERLTDKLAEHFAGLAGSIYMEDGVWHHLTVNYKAGNKDPCAIFKDERCEHIRKLYLNDINEHIANEIALLPELVELHVRKLGSVFHGDRDRRMLDNDEAVHVELEPDLWPQLHSLTVASFKARCDPADDERGRRDAGDHHHAHRVSDKLVSALAAAAPNLRRLHIDWTYRLDCLGQLLESLPALEELTLHYAVADYHENESVSITNCKPLDKVTPAALQCMVLVERQQPPKPDHYYEAGGECINRQNREVSLVRLAAALGCMRHRAPRRFAIDLCGKRI